MKTRNVEKKRLRRTEGYKHKLEESRDKKKEHSPYIPLFLVMILAVMLLFVGIGVASATDYYVATWGSDSNLGTETQPWGTIQKAANTLIAGDTVYIKEGTYNERVIPKNSGSPGNYITYTTYPSHTVTIDGTDKTWPWGGIFNIRGKNYIKVSGLRTINSAGFGITIQDHSSHIIVEKCYTYNTYESGIRADQSDNIIIDGNEVELACNDGGQECITMSDVDTFEVKSNHVHHSGPGSVGGEGIDAKGGCENGKIYNNYVHNINRIGIYVDAYDEHQHDIDVFQNVVHDCDSYGFVLASELGGPMDNITIYNNIAYNNKYSGLLITPWHIDGPMDNIKIINNAFYNNNAKGIWIQHTNVQNVVIRNNICSQNANQIVAASLENVTVDHNLIDGPTEVYGTDYITGDPKFVNPVEADFHLQSDSLAIDKGSSVNAPNADYDGNPRPQGAGYDIGAYEYVVDRPTGTISGIVKYISDLFRKIMPPTFLDNLRDVFPL